jgi:hypothetical protein
VSPERGKVRALSDIYDKWMEPIPENGRPVFFAELRPDLVYVTPDDRVGVAREVVALAIFEHLTVSWELPLDQWRSPVSFDQVKALIEATPSGEGKPVLNYYVLELEAQGRVVDDWVPGDLESAKEFLAGFAGAVWEELPTDHADALALISKRLAEPPRR